MKPLNKFFFPERTFCFGAKKRRRDGSLRPGCGRQKRSGAGRGLHFFSEKKKRPRAAFARLAGNSMRPERAKKKNTRPKIKKKQRRGETLENGLIRRRVPENEKFCVLGFLWPPNANERKKMFFFSFIYSLGKNEKKKKQKRELRAAPKTKTEKRHAKEKKKRGAPRSGRKRRRTPEGVKNDDASTQ
jgi:hypothetical protein